MDSRNVEVGGGMVDSARKKKVGHYIMERKLGEGHYSTVRLATHVIAQEYVAIRVVSMQTLTQKEAARRYFRRQALMAPCVDHPNIIRLYEAMETTNSVYLVLEFAENGSFCQYLAQKRSLCEEEVREYITQLVSAVNHMHISGIVHREIRLGNLLLDKDKNLKICDFGSGPASHVPGSAHPTKGIPSGYCSPEVINGKIGGTPVDIWSIGICLYTMLTGKLPFVAESLQHVHANIIHGCQMPETISSNCKDFLTRLLDPLEGKRISMTDILIHPWLTNDGQCPVEIFPPLASLDRDDMDINDDVINYLCHNHNFDKMEMVQSVRLKKMNNPCATYKLMCKSVDRGFILPRESTTGAKNVSPLSSPEPNSPRHGLEPLSNSPSRVTSWDTHNIPCKSPRYSQRDNRHRRTKSRRSKCFDPRGIPSPTASITVVCTPTKQRLPDITTLTRYYQPLETQSCSYGTFGRQRDALHDMADVLCVRGMYASALRSKCHSNDDVLMPRLFGFEPVVPPNTASYECRRLSCHKVLKFKKRMSIPIATVDRSAQGDTVSYERVKSTRAKDSRIKEGVLEAESRPILYVKHLSTPKPLSSRQRRGHAIEVIKAVSPAQSDIETAANTASSSSSTATAYSTDSEEESCPIIKVTIKTVQKQKSTKQFRKLKNKVY